MLGEFLKCVEILKYAYSLPDKHLQRYIQGDSYFDATYGNNISSIKTRIALMFSIAEYNFDATMMGMWKRAFMIFFICNPDYKVRL